MPQLDAAHVGQLLAHCGEFYWSTDFRNPAKSDELVAGPWRPALVDFLNWYAFERVGPRADYYKRAAVRAIEEQARSVPDAQLERDAWRSFCGQLRGRGINPKLQPLNPSAEDKLSILGLASGLEKYEFNLMRWARDGIATGELASVHRELRRVRGIGTKIAAFYLRDVITAHKLDEAELDPICFQPIDVWTRRGAQALSPLAGTEIPKSDARAASVLVQFARRVGVRPSIVNVGLWVFGALVVGSEGVFVSALTDRAKHESAVADARTRLHAESAKYDGLVRLAGELAKL